MTLVAIVALVALVAAAFSLLRLSRLPRAPLPPVPERTFDNLGAGDVVITPEGDFLVASRDEIAVDGVRAKVFRLRSGRDQRWLVVPAEGALLLATEPPETPRLATARKLERSSVELLPGA